LKAEFKGTLPVHLLVEAENPEKSQIAYPHCLNQSRPVFIFNRKRQAQQIDILKEQAIPPARAIPEIRTTLIPEGPGSA